MQVSTYRIYFYVFVYSSHQLPCFKRIEVFSWPDYVFTQIKNGTSFFEEVKKLDVDAAL